MSILKSVAWRLQLLGLRAPALNFDLETLIFTGVTTSACVGLIAREAVDRGFKCVIVEDAKVELEEVPYEAPLRQFAVGWERMWATGEALKNLAVVAGLMAFGDTRVGWPKENRDHDRND